MRLLLAWLINAVALFLLPYVFPWVKIDSFWAAVVAALVLGLDALRTAAEGGACFQRLEIAETGVD